MCALLPLSLYWLRRNMYEGFLFIHIAMSILVLAAMWGYVELLFPSLNIS